LRRSQWKAEQAKNSARRFLATTEGRPPDGDFAECRKSQTRLKKNNSTKAANSWAASLQSWLPVLYSSFSLSLCAPADLTMKITFLGAARTVTGSRHLLERNGTRIMVDCGLFQGSRDWKEKNWSDFPVDPSSVDCILLTHAHIDHAGFLPRFIQKGFNGPVYCTAATADLLGLMLPDAGHLQEEDAAFANKNRHTRHDPALPLYTEQDARNALTRLSPIDFYTDFSLGQDWSVRFLRAGHILGSAMAEMKSNGNTILFSGDVGRPSQYITKQPDNLENVDYLILESTYGNRLHQRIDVKQRLADIIKRTAQSGGTLLVPAFAIGRTQELLFILRFLEETNQVPKLPVYIDSPMAIHALPIYNRYPIDASKELAALTQKDDTPFVCHHIHALETVQESMTLNHLNYPAIIISSSGMATGGRILHHLKRRISDHRNTILFIGFQAEGTKGRFLVDGATEIKIHGQVYPVRAQIEYLDALSCHADYEEMLNWLTSIKNAPKHVFLVHGEETASQSMCEKIEQRFGWKTEAARYLESVEF
jgi:metallo-beta-lactamase family protein